MPIAETGDIVFVAAEVLLFCSLELERAELLVDDLPDDLI